MSLIRRLLLPLAMIAALTAGASAQDTDLYERGGVYLEADRVEYDKQSGRYVAEGNVTARYETRLIEAARLEYTPATGRVLAMGGVRIINADGSVQTAEQVELADDLTEGFAEDFAARLPEDALVMAKYAFRKNENRNELTNAVYTACPIPDDMKPPTWRLRARRVIQDGEAEMVYYRDAVFEVKGLPVFYMPFFGHPDPSVERKSGFLVPSFGLSDKVGAWYEQPYYRALSPSQDITIAPRIMSEVAPLMNVQYRKRFFSGVVELEGSATVEQLFDTEGVKFGEDEFRGHAFSSGLFAINDYWSWGFGLELVSDDQYLERYDLSESRERRGIYRSERKRLVSQIFTAGQDDQSYVTLAAADYQSLRENENDATLPRLQPILEARRQFDLNGFGRAEIMADVVSLAREDGVDYNRATGGIDWRERWTTPLGLVIEPFAQARYDAFQIDNVLDAATGDETDGEFTRFLSLGGIDLSYPMARYGESVDLFLEPRVQYVAAHGDNDDILDFATFVNLNQGRIDVLNEDSLTLDLDSSNLFAPNKFNGFDRWEEGQRLNYGARLTAQWGRRSEAEIFVGQSIRETTALLPQASGLDNAQSDYVIDASYSPSGPWRFGAKIRLDEDNFKRERLNLDAGYNGKRFSGSLSYISFSDSFSRRGPQDELRTSMRLKLTENWSVGYSNLYDGDVGEVRKQTFSIGYEDCCSALSIAYRDNNVSDRAIAPTQSITFRFRLKSLGAFGTN